jgi:peroxiredoxin
MPLMMTLNDTLKDRGFEVLTVSVDTSWQPIRDFYDQYEVSFPTLLDPAQAVSRGQYKVTGFPETFLIGADGHVLTHVIGALRWDDPREMAKIEQHLPVTQPGSTSSN